MEVLDKNGLVRFYQNCVLKFFSRKSEPVTDLDSLSEEGLYTCNASTTTLPDAVTSGRVLVTNSGDGASVTQLLLGSNNKVYVRTAPSPQDQSLSWGTWNSLLTSEDIPGDSTGQIQSLEEQLEALQQTVESNKTEADEKISSLETDLTSNYYDKSSVDITTGELSSRIDTVEATTGELSSRIDDVEATTGGLPGRIDAVEANLTNNYYDIIDIDATTGGLSSRIDSVEYNLTTNYYDKNNIDVTTEDLSSRIDSVEATTGELSGRIENVETNLAGNYYDKSYIDGTTGGLSSRIDTLEADKTNYVKVSDVANQADKIPRFNSEGHLVLPSGLEIW